MVRASACAPKGHRARTRVPGLSPSRSGARGRQRPPGLGTGLLGLGSRRLLLTKPRCSRFESPGVWAGVLCPASSLGSDQPSPPTSSLEISVAPREGCHLKSPYFDSGLGLGSGRRLAGARKACGLCPMERAGSLPPPSWRGAALLGSAVERK